MPLCPSVLKLLGAWPKFQNLCDLDQLESLESGRLDMLDGPILYHFQGS